jgi:hypothetical protein
MRKLKLAIEELAVKSFEVEQPSESRGTVAGNVVYCDGETDPKMEGPGPSGDSWHNCGTGYNCTAVNTCTGCVNITGGCTTYDNQGC